MSRKGYVLVGIAAALIVAVFAMILVRWPQGDRRSRMTQRGFEDVRVAARVNDAIITEGDVTRRIYVLRDASGLLENEAWAGWLMTQHTDAAGVRERAIQALVYDEEIEQFAKQERVTISEESVVERVSELKEAFFATARTSAGMTENDWTNALRLNGLNDEEFMRSVRTDILEAALAPHGLADFCAGCDVEIESMPDGLPYDLS